MGISRVISTGDRQPTRRLIRRFLLGLNLLSFIISCGVKGHLEKHGLIPDNISGIREKHKEINPTKGFVEIYVMDWTML